MESKEAKRGESCPDKKGKEEGTMSRDELEYCCAPRMGKRSFRLRCGGLLVIIGLLWLAQRAGLMQTEYLGPMVLLVIGFWFLVSSRFFKNGNNSTLQK